MKNVYYLLLFFIPMFNFIKRFIYIVYLSCTLNDLFCYYHFISGYLFINSDTFLHCRHVLLA